MISIGCLRAAGGIPEVVAEDIAFSVAVRRLGFRVAYAPELVCQEDYPIDYPAFRQQQRKAVEGNLEFLRHYLGMIVTGPLRSGEKIDLLAEQLAPVLGPLVGLGLFGTASAAAATGTALPGWIYLGAGLGAITPLLPEAVRRGVSSWCRRGVRHHALVDRRAEHRLTADGLAGGGPGRLRTAVRAADRAAGCTAEPGGFSRADIPRAAGPG